MKKIWICGANGMLGSHFTRLLKQNNIPFLANDSQQVDITELDQVSNFVRAQKISHIINCAAYTQVDKAEEELKKAYLVNAVGPENLGVAARRHGARVIHFSTDYVFDGQGHKPYSEEHICSPINAYGMSKWAGEIKLLNSYPQACVIRTSWLYGLPGKNFVETMVRLMSEKETLRVVSDQIGRPTYCEDLAEAALQLLDHEGIFHFANSNETSWYDFAKEIHRQSAQMGFALKVQKIDPITTKDYPTPAKRPFYSTLDTKKLEKLLDKKPRTWNEALKDYLGNLKTYQTNQQI